MRYFVAWIVYTTLYCIDFVMKGRMKRVATCFYPDFFHFKPSYDSLIGVLQNEASHETFMERFILFFKRHSSHETYKYRESPNFFQFQS